MRIIHPLILVASVAACGGTPNPGDDTAADPDAPPGGTADARGGIGPDANTFPPCHGTLTGGIAGAVSGCDILMAYRDPQQLGLHRILIRYTLLDGVPFEDGPFAISFELPGPPDTSTTYTFANLGFGLADLDAEQPDGNLVGWLCEHHPEDTSRNVGSIAIRLDALVVTQQPPLTVWEAHGDVTVHAVRIGAGTGPDVDLALAF